jgi:hypothetical protein
MKRCSDRLSRLVVLSLAVALAGCGDDGASGGTGGGGGTAGAGGAAGGGPSGMAGAGGGGAAGMGGGAGAAGAGGRGGSAGGAGAGGADAPLARPPDARRPDAARGPDARPADGRAGDAGGAARTVLFGGDNLAAWVGGGGGNPRWTVADGAFQIVAGTGDIRTRQRFGDMRLHIEFNVPRTPATNGEQDRGNSGVYLQGRYEIQILDSFDRPLNGDNDCASIYAVKNPDVNAATPPETWQTYDIVFRAARYNGNAKVANARVTVTWNGQVVHRDVPITGPTGSGDAESAAPAALRLQEHAHPVRFRNIWVEELR